MFIISQIIYVSEIFAHSLPASCVIKTEIADQAIIHEYALMEMAPRGEFMLTLNHHAMGIN